MKKILLALFPFVALADTCTLYQEGGGEWRIVCEGNGIVTRYEDVTNEVYIIENCEQLKSSLLDLINNNRLFAHDAKDEIENTKRLLGSFSPYLTTPATTNIYNNLWDSLEEVDGKVGYVESTMSPIEWENSDSLYSQVYNINCGSCPPSGEGGGGSGGSCCDVDFTEIIDRLIVAEQQRAAISNQIARIFNYLGVVTNQIAYNNFLLEHGFGSVTNLLIDSLFYNSYLHEDMLGEWNTYHFQDFSSRNWEEPSFTVYEDAPFIALFNAHYYNQLQGLLSANNYNYNFQYRLFPAFTNEFASYRRDFLAYSDETTNFFSFFRGEIGVRGVLEDWTNLEADGTYHDFLTNHYINVVRGGPLSGFSYEKTNWFSRVETLLAALVFRDEGDITGTNLVDGARYDTEKNQIKDALQESITYLGAPVGKLQNMTEPLVRQLSDFSDSFSSAILPSHITLFSLGNGETRSSSVTPFDVTFLVDSEQQAYYGIIRSCTTLCWVFVSLLLIYWFLVWSINKIIVIVRFFWNVAEMFMSRNG